MTVTVERLVAAAEIASAFLRGDISAPDAEPRRIAIERAFSLIIEALDEMEADCDREPDSDSELESAGWGTIGAQWDLTFPRLPCGSPDMTHRPPGVLVLDPQQALNRDRAQMLRAARVLMEAPRRRRPTISTRVARLSDEAALAVERFYNGRPLAALSGTYRITDCRFGDASIEVEMSPC